MYIFDQNNYKISDGLAPIFPSGGRLPIGVGFIVLNTSEERSDYVENCYRTNTVSIVTIQGDIIRNCIVPKDLWNNIVFPEDNNSKGSLAAWMNVPLTESVILLGVLETKFEYTKKGEQEFIYERKTKDASFHISGDGKKGLYNLFVEGNGSDNSQINISALNTAIQALLNIYVQGNFAVETDDSISFKTLNKFYINVKDESDSKKNTEIYYEQDKGFFYIDQFGNKINIDDSGVSVVDKNKNSIKTNNTGIFLEDRFGNVITMINGTIGVTVAASGMIEIKSKNSQSTSSGVLGEEIKKSIEDLTDQVNNLSKQLIIVATAAGAGTAIPAINTIISKLQLIKKDFSKFISKTLKIS